MSMNLTLHIIHSVGHETNVPLTQTPTEITFEILESEYPGEAYLAWKETNMKALKSRRDTEGEKLYDKAWIREMVKQMKTEATYIRKLVANPAIGLEWSFI